MTIFNKNVKRNNFIGDYFANENKYTNFAF